MPESQHVAGRQPGEDMAVPDLSLKLLYMLQRRCDQRPLPETAKIRSNEALARELGVTTSSLQDWNTTNKIPAAVAALLCQIFAIDPAWLALPFAEFTPTCEGAAAGWNRLMELARVNDVGDVTAVQGPNRWRHALPADLPEPAYAFKVDRGSDVEVRLQSPLNSSGQVDWQDWYVVLFSEDPDGYYCLLPRHNDLGSMPPARIPANGAVHLRLKLDPHKAGVHSFVLVALKAALPQNLVAMLREPVEGLALMPALEKLARHALPLVRSAQGGVLRLTYFVR